MVDKWVASLIACTGWLGDKLSVCISALHQCIYREFIIIKLEETPLKIGIYNEQNRLVAVAQVPLM